MNNFLDNGTVLPSHLLGVSPHTMTEGFKKSFQNTGLRVGVIVQTYDITDTNNVSKLVPEYDVLVFEQNENSGSTPITYKNCPSSQGLGSIADFLEYKLRKLEKKTTPGVTPQLAGQNGAVVLVLCLNGMSDTGVIVGALYHPDRPTTLTGDKLHLEGEYNGVNIKVNDDGSCSLTFMGATDNDGKVTDTSQGNTVISIEKDGSYQVNHKTITQRLDKNGKATLTATDDISNNTQKNFNITAQQNVVVNAAQDIDAISINMLFQASGTATFACQEMIGTSQSNIGFSGNTFQLTAQSLARISAPSITLNGQVALGGDGGQPVLLLSLVTMGVGNIGLPVISTVISGFATRVTGI